MTAARKKNLKWTCDVCELEQTIRTPNKAWARELTETAHERPCLDPECRERGGVVRMPVKLTECTYCGEGKARVVKGGPKLAPATYCSHRCRGAALDELETGGKA